MSRRLIQAGRSSCRRLIARSGGAASSIHLADTVGPAMALPWPASSRPSFQSARAQSSMPQVNAYPSYPVFGEMTAFTVKAIPPSFRLLNGKTVILDASKRGRVLLEWVPRKPTMGGKYNWETPMRFALSAEEAGLLVARIKNGGSVELSRQTRPENTQFGAAVNSSLQKVFRAFPKPDGSVQFVCDYQLDGVGGQDPPTPNEPKGPIEISLMVGEYQVIQSIIEYSIPRLVGWTSMMDHAMQQSFLGAEVPSPHNYSGGSRGGGGNYSSGNRGGGGNYGDGNRGGGGMGGVPF